MILLRCVLLYDTCTDQLREATALWTHGSNILMHMGTHAFASRGESESDFDDYSYHKIHPDHL